MTNSTTTPETAGSETSRPKVPGSDGRADGVTFPPTVTPLTLRSTGRPQPWARRFAWGFGVITMVAVLAATVPVMAGADPDYLGVATPVFQWVPALVLVLLQVTLKPPVKLLPTAAVRGPFSRVASQGGLLLGLLIVLPLVTIGLSSALGFVAFDPVDDAATTAVAIVPVLLVAMLLTFGEEVAWRGHLTTILAPLGFWRATLGIGVFWAVWHVPLTAAYAMAGEIRVREVVVTTVNLVLASVALSAVRYTSRSVWPAVLGHAALNTVLVYAYSNLMTATDELSNADYWGHAAAAWAVWIAVDVFLIRRMKHRLGSV